MMPNINGTMGHKILTKKHPRHMEHSVLFKTQQTETRGIIPSRKCNYCVWASVEQLVAEISESQ